jgi:small-conductance mechanosensitive channel
MRYSISLLFLLLLNSPFSNAIDSLLQDRVDSLISLQARMLALDSLSKDIQRRNAALQQKLAEIPTFELSSPLVSLRNQVPIVLETDTLWWISQGSGVLSIKDRARGIQNRLSNLIELNPYYSDSLRLIEKDRVVYLMYKREKLFSLTEVDALPYNTTPLNLGIRIKSAVDVVVSHHNTAYKDKGFLYKITGVIIVVLLLFGLVKLLTFLFRLLKKRIFNMKDIILKGIHVKNVELMNSNQEIRVIFLFIDLIKIFVFVLLFYIALPIGFSFFSFTRGWTSVLFNAILSPLKRAGVAIVDYIPSLITIIVIYFIFRLFIRFVKLIFQKLESEAIKIPGFFPDWAMPTYRIVSTVSYIFMFIVIFPYLPGSDSPVFRGVSVFLGVLFSLGSTSAIANLVAGLVITYMRPFKIGDRVQIGDVLGNVVEKNLLVTRLLTPKNEEVTIPNSNILTSKNMNFSTTSTNMGLILHSEVTIGYDVPWKKVHEMLIEAANRTDGIIKEKKPFVLQTALNDFYISYEINVYTDKPKFMALIYSRLHQNIQDVFNEADVEILSPHYKVNRFEGEDDPSRLLKKDGGNNV